MTGPLVLASLDLAALGRYAALLALMLRPGDVVTLSGELGAGKTTLARALIGALRGDDAEVASPSFPLVQTYDTPRMDVAHFDLYRLRGPAELDEIGFLDATSERPGGPLVLIEWPDRAGDELPSDRLDITITQGPDTGTRGLTISGHGAWRARAERLGHIIHFLDQARWGGATARYLQGDASTRAYARLEYGRRTAILMDAPRQPDGPAVRDGLPYSRIARLAEDVRPFMAVAGGLRAAGLSAPQIYAADCPQGLLLIEDLGDRVFGREIRGGTPQPVLWRAAVDALLQLRQRPFPAELPVGDGSLHRLPRFNRAALGIEVGLLLDWYWPEVKGAPAPDRIRAEYMALWAPLLDRLLALPPGIFLRDYHSPNLLWLPERDGIARVGIIDFQDALAEHWAFDLASLLQDARVDVPVALERELLQHYCASVAAAEPEFDAAAFRAAYALFGAQRNSRLIGLWVRLLRRDGKPGYLQHMERTWDYLERNLRAAGLGELETWLEAHLPRELRARPITP
jgi:hypothetical protein